MGVQAFWAQIGERSIRLDTPIELAPSTDLDAGLYSSLTEVGGSKLATVPFVDAFKYVAEPILIQPLHTPLSPSYLPEMAGIRYRPDIVRTLAQKALPLHHLARAFDQATAPLKGKTTATQAAEIYLEALAGMFRGLILSVFIGFSDLFLETQKLESLPLTPSQEIAPAVAEKTTDIVRDLIALELHASLMGHYASTLDGPKFFQLFELLKADYLKVPRATAPADLYKKLMKKAAQILGLLLAA